MPPQNLTRVELSTPAQMTPAQRAFWSETQQANPTLESPFFRPEYVEAVSSVRDDVELAWLYDGEALLGVFPFQRDKQNLAIPVGGWFSDYHGVIAPADAEWSPPKLLAGCGLHAWRFNHTPAAQAVWQPYGWRWIAATSPYLDLSQGFAAYRQERKQARSELLEQTLRKARKLQREIGPLRVVEHDTQRIPFEEMLNWKIAQYRAMGVRNYLGPQWAVNVLQQLIQTAGPHFAGRLTTLYAGERLAAIILSVRSAGVWHALVMTYNQQLARYSPGLVLLMEMAQQSENWGIRKLDLGRGTEPYKLRLMSGATPLVEGAVDLRRWSGWLDRSFSRTKEYVRVSPLGKPAQHFIRTARSWLFSG